jgi:hypothetical protein
VAKGVHRGTGRRPNEDDYLKKIMLALRARDAGLTWERAAEEAGYFDRATCHKAVMNYLRQQAIEAVTEHRQLHGRRYERMIAAMWTQAIGNPAQQIPPDPNAVREVRLLNDSLVRLYGTAMPTKIEVTDAIDAEIMRLAEALSVEDTDITANEAGDQVQEEV